MGSPFSRFTKGCQAKPELRASKHLYLKLNALQPEIEKWTETSFKNWASNGVVRLLTRDMLPSQNNQITVRKSHGRGSTKGLIPAVSHEILSGVRRYPCLAMKARHAHCFCINMNRLIIVIVQVFYVWFDACIGYVSITANYTPEWRQWWQNKSTEIYMFMAKDNVPFHGIIFPGSLIGTRKPWSLVKSIQSTEYLDYEGEAFSKVAPGTSSVRQ